MTETEVRKAVTSHNPQRSKCCSLPFPPRDELEPRVCSAGERAACHVVLRDIVDFHDHLCDLGEVRDDLKARTFSVSTRLLVPTKQSKPSKWEAYRNPGGRKSSSGGGGLLCQPAGRGEQPSLDLKTLIFYWACEVAHNWQA